MGESSFDQTAAMITESRGHRPIELKTGLTRACTGRGRGFRIA